MNPSPRVSSLKSQASSLFLCFLLSCIAAAPSLADIYRYQDAAGVWHFTDQPPDYKTPMLPLRKTRRPEQGTRVYAIGNSMLMQDSVTAGIVTHVAGRRISTDAQILPGNSGGPLISESGEVLGINVAKVVAGGSPYTEGFGQAIPAGVALDAFRHLLP